MCSLRLKKMAENVGDHRRRLNELPLAVAKQPEKICLKFNKM